MLAPSVAPALDGVENDPRWTAFMARDVAADDRFVTAVLSTRIYCRPSCPARRPKPENVRFYATGGEAEAAGFRACRRCRPDQPSRSAAMAEIVTEACRRIAEAESPPKLAALAQAAGMSPFHFHRLFKAVMGVTPKGFAEAERSRRMRAALSDGSTSVTAAIYEAGYGSNGRFYAAADDMLGMTPTVFRNGGRGMRIRFATRPCSLGIVLAAASPCGLCAILLGDDANIVTQELKDRFPKAVLDGGDAAFASTLEAVVAIVEAPGTSLNLPLDIVGTAFQRRVWEVLRTIPAGKTMTYRELAEAVDRPKAVRAVANACAANALAVAIPCHRVVHSDGKASGYRWGAERKRALLSREA